MSFLSRRLAVVIASIVLLIGGCAADLDERRLGFVSMGMTPSQVARVLGAPARRDFWFEPSGYVVLFRHGKLDGIAQMAPSDASSSTKLAALSLGADASVTDFEAALGKPVKEEAWYYVNEVYAFRVYFENGRVVKKEKFDFPPI